MKTKNIELTSDELREIRGLVCSEMQRASEILDRTGGSSDPADRKLFSYWLDKYQALKSSYDKLFKVSYGSLCGGPPFPSAGFFTAGGHSGNETVSNTQRRKTTYLQKMLTIFEE